MPSASSVSLAFRISFAGLPTEFVTDRRMEKEVDDRKRKVGFLAEDLQIEDEINIPNAEVEASDITVEIVDVDKQATKLFGKVASVTAYLVEDITPADTSLTVTSTEGFSEGDYIYVGSETMLIFSIHGSTTMTVLRAMWDTVAQGHYTQQNIDIAGTTVENHPSNVKSRRARLYMYVIGEDDLKGDGQLIWKGICSTDANYRDGKWSILVDPITKLLDQEMGSSAEDGMAPRGIHYHEGSMLLMTIHLCKFPTTWQRADDVAGSNNTLVSSSTVIVPRDTGTFFWETQEEFCNDLTVAISASIKDWTNHPTITAIPDGNAWTFTFEPDPNETLAVICGADSAVDGIVGDFYFPQGYGQWSPSGSGASNGTHRISAGTSYRNVKFGNPDGIQDPGTVPRGFFGRARGATRSDGQLVLYGFQPHTRDRIYLGGQNTLDRTANRALIEWGDESEDDTAGVTERVIRESNLSERWVRLFDADGFNRLWTAGNEASVKLHRWFSVDGVRNFSDLIEAFTDDSPEYKNTGQFPELYAEDVNLSEIRRSWEEAARDKELAQRFYTAVPGEALKDIFAEEMKLIGVYPAIDSSGSITMRPIKTPSQNDFKATLIEGKDILVDDGLGSWERTGDGGVNTITLKTGYNYIEEDHEGRTFVIRDIRSLSRDRMAQQIEVEPMSLWTETNLRPNAPTRFPVYEQALELFSPLLGLYGHSYATVEVDINVNGVLDLRAGDLIRLTHPHIPDFNGNIGVVREPAIILKRSWEPRQKRAQLTLMMFAHGKEGYAPTAGITGQSNVSGNRWSLNVTLGDPLAITKWADDGTEVGDFFLDGWQIQIHEWNKAGSLTRIAGQVVSTGTGTMTVDLDSAWTPGSDLWVVTFDDSDQVLENQIIRGQNDADGGFAFWGGNDRRLLYAETLFRGAYLFGA